MESMVLWKTLLGCAGFRTAGNCVTSEYRPVFVNNKYQHRWKKSYRHSPIYYVGYLAMVFATLKEWWKLINIWLSYGQQKGDTWHLTPCSKLLICAEFHKVVRAATFEIVWKILPGFSCNYSSFYNSKRILKIGQHLTKLQSTDGWHFDCTQNYPDTVNYA